MHDDAMGERAWRAEVEKQDTRRAFLTREALKMLREDAIRRGAIAEVMELGQMLGERSFSAVEHSSETTPNRAQRRAAKRKWRKG